MTPEKTMSVFYQISTILQENGAEKAERLDEAQRKLPQGSLPPKACLNHMLYLAHDGIALMLDLRYEKAHRHLGWLQGAMWGAGLRTIDELMEMNRP